jgi:PKD repeat protein
MNRIIKLIACLIPVLLVWSCIDEYRLDADPPTVEEAGFSFSSSAESDNILNFVGDNDFFLMVWDLGNGVKAEGRRVTGFFPLAGTYTVTLTIYSKGGSATFNKEIIIERTDPTLLNRPVFNLLTGGLNALNGKTWVIDSARAGHLGVGPIEGTFPEFYQARANEKVGSGMYNTRYTFKLDGFKYDWNTNGLIYLNAAQGAAFPGAFDPGVGDLSAPFVSPGGLNWNLIEEEGKNPILSVTNPGFIGYFTGVRTYEIMKLEENEMFLRFTDGANGALAWYVRLIPVGFVAPDPEPIPENPDVNFTLNDLIGAGSKTWKLQPAAGAFGVGPARGSDAFFPNGTNISGDRPCLFNDLFTFNQNGTYAYDAQGDIFGESYMGLAAEGCQPESNLAGTPGAAWASGTHQYSFTPGTATDFPKITVTGTGAFLVLPKAFNGGEYNAGPPRVNASVTYDVIGYDRATGAMQLSIDITGNGSVFWNFTLVPSSSQVPPQPEGLRLQDLIGNGTKAWKLKPAAGAFGVGPSPGSDAFFPNGPNISGDRPCLFNDLYIFKENGVYEYDAKGDIYAEDYMGISGGGCQPVANLAGTPGAAWGNGIHEFDFTPASGSNRAKISVTGTGAFIVLPKAFNGGEYTQGPPRPNEKVTYDVLDYNPITQELTLVIDITNNGDVWWTFVLIPAN